MANHEFDHPLTVHFSTEGDYASIKATKDYKAGDEVTIFYGIRTNRQFFLHNGFVPDGENKNDTYKLKIGELLKLKVIDEFPRLLSFIL